MTQVIATLSINAASEFGDSELRNFSIGRLDDQILHEQKTCRRSSSGELSFVGLKRT